MTNTLDGNDLGIIHSEDHQVFSNLSYESTPLGTSPEAFILDYEGVKRIITITGIYSADTKAELINDFVIPIENLQNGNQSTVVFHSDLYDEGSGESGDFNVKVDDFKWKYMKDAVGKVEFTLRLLEGQ